jgi:glycosyltransferase involved in cell wall biosynthesis
MRRTVGVSDVRNMNTGPTTTRAVERVGIKVLHLISSFNQGGSETQAIQLAARLANVDGTEVLLASLRDEGPLRDWAGSLGFTDPAVFPITSFYGWSFLREIRRFRDFVDSNRIDIIHCHDFYTNVFGLVAARKSDAGTTIAAKRETTGTRTQMQSFVETLLFKRAQTIVANSRAVGAFLQTMGVPESRIRVIYNGVTMENRANEVFDEDEIRSALGLPDDRHVKFITLVANFGLEVKNQEMLLRAVRPVLDRHPDTHFVLAGEGRRKDELKGMAVELGISHRTHFIGRCSRVPDLLRISFAGVLTSNAEGFANAILEYMAAGLPVVVTDVGGAREVVVDGETGYIVPVDDADALADRLITLLDNVSHAAEIGRRGKTVVRERFSPEAQVKETMRLYKHLVGLTTQPADVER